MARAMRRSSASSSARESGAKVRGCNFDKAPYAQVRIWRRQPSPSSRGQRCTRTGPGWTRSRAVYGRLPATGDSSCPLRQPYPRMRTKPAGQRTAHNRMQSTARGAGMHDSRFCPFSSALAVRAVPASRPGAHGPRSCPASHNARPPPARAPPPARQPRMRSSRFRSVSRCGAVPARCRRIGSRASRAGPACTAPICAQPRAARASLRPPPRACPACPTLGLARRGRYLRSRGRPVPSCARDAEPRTNLQAARRAGLPPWPARSAPQARRRWRAARRGRARSRRPGAPAPRRRGSRGAWPR